ncbi:MAG: class I SAM-dependent methyltransferase [Lentimicrobiaceae bacterium]|nr:class I SAM-dependent methyltransferase [Lentimicrobiaceae bacterium]
MQHRHLDRQQYFNEQVESTRDFVLPYIKNEIPSLKTSSRVLEIGCGEGGNLVPFLELGCECYGVELSEGNYQNALKFYENCAFKSRLHLFNNDIYKVTPQELKGTFDVIFLRDVLEHIPKQEQFMQHLKQFLSPDGVVFFAFPPWRMPFGGHQQICRNKFLSKLPYFHILPKIIYEKILKIGGENPNGLLEIKETGISLNRFEKIIHKENYEVIKKTYWFINPNYKVKFGLKPRKLPKIFQIPFLQDFYITTAYYLLKL